MLGLKKIAITGGTACGKSQVCRFLQQEGAFVVDADQIVHQLLTSDTVLSQQIVELLGKSVLVNGKIDRAQVAARVFSNPKLLNSLEALLHPRVYEKLDKQFEEVQMTAHPPLLFVAEIPLLFETKGEKRFDAVVAVVSHIKTCQERYRNLKGKKNSMDFEKRVARQMAIEEKIRRADFVIENEGTLEHLRQETKKLFYRLVI